MKRVALGSALMVWIGLALLPAGVAAALPGSCESVCSCTGSCLWKCTDGNIYPPTTCGAYGVCRGACGLQRATPGTAAWLTSLEREVAAAGSDADDRATGDAGACADGESETRAARD